jgi:hypothetical protein
MLEREWGAFVEVARRNNAEGSSVVERARLAEVLETVMGDTARGAEMRRRVKEIQESAAPRRMVVLPPRKR